MKEGFGPLRGLPDWRVHVRNNRAHWLPNAGISSCGRWSRDNEPDWKEWGVPSDFWRPVAVCKVCARHAPAPYPGVSA